MYTNINKQTKIDHYHLEVKQENENFQKYLQKIHIELTK